MRLRHTALFTALLAGLQVNHSRPAPPTEILFVVPGVAARSDGRPARTIDIAPTLAALLGIRPTEPADGRSLIGR